MTRLNRFITKEELIRLKIEHSVSGMWLSGGQPLGDVTAEVERLRKLYGMPVGTGLDLHNGEFVSPD